MTMLKPKVQSFTPKFPVDRIKDTVLSGMQAFFGKLNSRFHWDSDEKETGVMIVDKYALNLESVDRVPIIATSRGPITKLSRTLDDIKSINMSTGDKQRMDLLQCPLNIGCYSKEGLDSERLASIVFGLFLMFREQFRRNDLWDVINPVLGEEQIVKADSEIEYSITPVTMTVLISESWITQPLAALLENILDPFDKSVR